MQRPFVSISIVSLVLVGAVSASGAPPARIAAKAAAGTQARVTAVQEAEALPLLRIVDTPQRFDPRVTLDLVFGYAFAAAPGGRATVELWLRREGVHRAQLLGIRRDTALAPQGSFSFEVGPDDLAPIDPPCDRGCLLLLKVKRGSHERSVQMGLEPILLEELAATDRTVTPVGEGLAAYRMSLQSYERPCSSCALRRAKIGVGRDFDILRVLLRSPQGETAPSFRNVQVEAHFRDRRGREQIVAAKRIATLSGGRAGVDLDVQGFRVPSRGVFEVRVLAGRDSLRAVAPLVPLSYRVTRPARVRDRR